MNRPSNPDNSPESDKFRHEVNSFLMSHPDLEVPPLPVHSFEYQGWVSSIYDNIVHSREKNLLKTIPHRSKLTTNF